MGMRRCLTDNRHDSMQPF